MVATIRQRAALAGPAARLRHRYRHQHDRQEQRERRWQQHPRVHEVAADRDDIQRHEQAAARRGGAADGIGPAQVLSGEKEEDEQDEQRNPKPVRRGEVREVDESLMEARARSVFRHGRVRHQQAVVAHPEHLVRQRHGSGDGREHHQAPPGRTRDVPQGREKPHGGEGHVRRTSQPSPAMNASQQARRREPGRSPASSHQHKPSQQKMSESSSPEVTKSQNGGSATTTSAPAGSST